MKCDSGKHKGAVMLIVGLALIANQQWLNWNWWLVIGGLIALKGVWMMTMNCDSKK